MFSVKHLNRWSNMMSRCYDPHCKSYKSYGARGIYVCDRWHTYRDFAEDIGECPPGMTMDRIDNDGPYSPENVRWADRITQANNKRSNRIIVHDGKKMTLSRWADALGMDVGTLHGRLKRYEGDMAKAINPPEPEYQVYEFNGVKACVGKIVEETGISRSTLMYRLLNGMDVEDAKTKSTDIKTYLKHKGDRKSLQEWAEEVGVLPNTLCTRLRDGWSVEEALGTPTIVPETHTMDGHTRTASEWAEAYGLPRWVVVSRLQMGWTIEKAVSEPVNEKNQLVEAFGKSMTIIEWANESGIAEHTLRYRLKKMSPEKALSKPVGNNRGLELTAFGKSQKLTDWSRERGIHVETLRGRIKKGMTLEEAITAA